MKTLKKYWAVLMLTCLALGLAGSEKAMAQGGTYVSFQTFYDELSPYGRWINYPGHGYVWSPDVEAGFQPYATRGHWVVTQYGNTWVSDYAWGWAPFHYGRWLWDDFIGWVWVPGHEWGPAWVNWRTGGNYYGWAPLGPGMHVNIHINIPMNHWVFVPRRHIMHRRVYNYFVPRTTIVNVYHHTTIINNYYTNNNRTYVYGPRVQEIQQHTRGKVPVYRVDQDSRPGRAVVDRGSVRMYRPEVQDQRNEAPARAISREDFHRQERSSTAGGNNQPRSERSSGLTGNDTPARSRSSEDVGNVSREKLAQGTRSDAANTNLPELKRPVRENTQNRESISREVTAERKATRAGEATPERDENTFRNGDADTRTSMSEANRMRDATRNRTESPAFERNSSSEPAREQVVRERPSRIQRVPERPANTEMPAQREMAQPERKQMNPGSRQEQPATRPTPRAAPDNSLPARTQRSQPQQLQQSRPSEPQRLSRATQAQPQQQESAPSRRIRN